MTEKCYTYRLPDEKHFQGLCSNRFFGVNDDCYVCVSPKENTIEKKCAFPVVPTVYTAVLGKKVSGTHVPGTICFESDTEYSLLFSSHGGSYCEWSDGGSVRPVVLEKYVNSINPIQGCGRNTDISKFSVILDEDKTIFAELGIPSDINGIAPVSIAIRWKKMSIHSPFDEMVLQFSKDDSYRRISEFFTFPETVTIKGELW